MKKLRKSKKFLRRPMVQEVAVQFKKNLPPVVSEPKRITRAQRRTVPHYELAQAAITEFIQSVDDALSQNHTVILRGFGSFIPRRYKPMTGRLPGAAPDDKNAVYSIPLRVGVLFRTSPKLKTAIRAYDKEHGLPKRRSSPNNS